MYTRLVESEAEAADAAYLTVSRITLVAWASLFALGISILSLNLKRARQEPPTGRSSEPATVGQYGSG